jgi:hypothetical protein
MPIEPYLFGLESRPGRFGPDSGSILINCYAEEAPRDADVPYFLKPRPGLTFFAGLSGTGTFRGGIDLGTVGYVIFGTNVQKVTSAGTVTSVGTFSGDAPVFMAQNRKSPDAQIALVSEGQRSILSADSVNAITDTDLPAPVGVDSIGGYFVFAIDDGRYFWTSIDEGTEIDALDFASAEQIPDGLRGVKTRGQEIILLGLKSIEFHALTGTDSVFERVQNTTLELGCLSAAATKSLNGVPIMPASDATIRMLSAYSPQRISNHDVESDIDELSDKQSLTAFTFQMAGHQWYVLNSPNWTWACDLLTRFWFKWESYGGGRWNIEGFVDVDGKRIVGHYNEPKLYEMSSDAYDDAGTHLIWKLIGRLSAYPGRIELNDFYANLLPGVGLQSSDENASNPKAMMRVSKDNGKTWGNFRTREVGKIGAFNKRTKFGRFGTSKEDGFMVELSMASPVAKEWTGSAADYEVAVP